MNSTQYVAMVAEAENRLTRLRSLYEQWFSGIERVEPTREREALDQFMNRLRNEQPRNTAARFRYSQLVQRYVTYTTYWKRVTRQIEEGTFRRDVLRARRLRTSLPQTRASARPEIHGAADPEEGTHQELQPQTNGPSGRAAAAHDLPPPPIGGQNRRVPQSLPPVPTQARKAQLPVPPRPIGQKQHTQQNADQAQLNDDQVRAIYERFVAARHQNRERTDNVSFEMIAKNVRSAMPKLSQKHAGKRIEFQAVVRDGKVALKPIAK